MQIIENKALLLTTRKADQIVRLIPKSKLLERQGDLGRVLVNWGYDEARILRNLRIKDVPSPILGKYKWPGIFSPFDHQRTTAAFLTSHPRAFVLSDPGTGKTGAAAWAADYLMTIGVIKRVLIVCPVSIMETAWLSDLFKTVMHRTAALAVGPRAKREAVIAGGYEFVIINYDGVKVVREALANGGFDLIIADEANAVKSVTTDRWRALAGLITAHTRLWMMTGTPAAQSPVDAYGLAKLVNPAGVPKFFGAFRDRVMYKATQFKWIPRANASEIVHSVLQPAIRFSKAECLDLPDMLYTTREVPLTAQQEKYYEKIRKSMVATAAGERITAVNAAGMINKLLQISQGVAYTEDREVVEFDMRNRMDELLDVIRATPNKVIVFVPFKHALERVEQELIKEGISVATIHGGTPASHRAQNIKRFQTEDDPRVIMLIPQAAAHGITLTKADTIVWWGPIASAELYMQGNARAHRAGQRNPVTVVRIQGSPVEKRIYNLLDGKVDLHQGLVELYEQEIA